MKRIFTPLFLSFFLYQAKAQVLFSQDFETGTLAPMTAVDVDGKPVNPGAPTFCGPTWTVVGNAKNKLVVSTSWVNPVGVVDDWMMTPAIPITEANTFLFWEAYAPDANYRDGYEVRVSTTDNQVASFTNVVYTNPAEETTTQKRFLRMDAFIGQTIYIAFRNNSDDKFLLYMDNISVQILKSEDIVVKALPFEKYNPVGTQVPVKVTIENNGFNPLTSLVFSWNDGNASHSDTISGLNILTRQSKDITHSITYPVTAAGEFPINISLEQPNGTEEGDPYNNFGIRNVYGLTEQLPKKVVVEEGTGTWCGWCPRGFVTMEVIGENYPQAIPIAIHNYDPMLVPDYDTPFSLSIAGYPSGHVDRKELGIDPNSPSTGYGFINAIGNLETRMVPVQVATTTYFDEGSRTLQITGTAHSSIPTQANRLRFSAIITENHVTGAHSAVQLSNYDQVNYYAANANGPMGGFESLPNPVPAAQMIYNFVARAILGGYFGAEGSISPVLEANDDFTFQFTYVVPAGYNIDNMNAIVMVLDDETGEILNGDIVKARNEVSSVPLVPAGKFSLYPNPTTDVLNLSVDFQTVDDVSMNIYDTNGRLIKKLENLDLSSGIRTKTINVAEIPTGEYLLELRDKKSVTAIPITKI
jgi:hypothetical protein